MKLLLLPLAVAAAIASLNLAGCASAQSGNAALMKRFKQADRSGDGKVSRDEFTDFMITEAFGVYDRDGKGYVTMEEFVAGGGTPSTYRKIDRTGKGKVTLADAKASKVVRNWFAQPFDEADADTGGNGFISFDEFVAFRKKATDYVR